MPPKNKDDLVEAILDSRIVFALADALMPRITLSIDAAIDKRIAELAVKVEELIKSNDSLPGKSDSLQRENNNLHKQLDEQSYRLNVLDSYSRADNLIIKGLPEKTFAEKSTSSSLTSDLPSAESQLSVESTVIEFCLDVLNIPLTKQDISTKHRLKGGSKDTIRPILVRFTNQQVLSRKEGPKVDS